MNPDDMLIDGENRIVEKAFAALVMTLLEGRITSGGSTVINNGDASIPARTIRQIAC